MYFQYIIPKLKKQFFSKCGGVAHEYVSKLTSIPKAVLFCSCKHRKCIGRIRVKICKSQSQNFKFLVKNWLPYQWLMQFHSLGNIIAYFKTCMVSSRGDRESIFFDSVLLFQKSDPSSWTLWKLHSDSYLHSENLKSVFVLPCEAK